MVSLKDQLWIHDYDWESCNDRKCDKDQESDDDQKPHNSGCCKSESEKTIELSGHHLVENVQTILVKIYLLKFICLNVVFFHLRSLYLLTFFDNFFVILSKYIFFRVSPSL